MAELWDLVDVDRCGTGELVLRPGSGQVEGLREIQQGDFHIVVAVAVFRGEEMLIQQRAADKVGWSGMWDVTAGGSILAGETSREGIARELLEEVGIAIDFTGVRPALTVACPQGFEDYYQMDAPDGLDIDSLRLQAEEVQAVRWADLATITAMMDAGEFIRYQPGLIDAIFAMHRYPGALAPTDRR